MARKNSNTLLDFANVLTAFSNLVLSGLNVISAAGLNATVNQRDHLHTQGLALKNRLTAQKIATEQHRTAVTSNKIVETDQKIERNELELKFIREKLRIAGLLNDGTPGGKFTAANYADPHDVRRGNYPPPHELQESNQF